MRDLLQEKLRSMERLNCSSNRHPKGLIKFFSDSKYFRDRAKQGEVYNVPQRKSIYPSIKEDLKGEERYFGILIGHAKLPRKLKANLRFFESGGDWIYLHRDREWVEKNIEGRTECSPDSAISDILTSAYKIVMLEQLNRERIDAENGHLWELLLGDLEGVKQIAEKIGEDITEHIAEIRKAYLSNIGWAAPIKMRDWLKNVEKDICQDESASTCFSLAKDYALAGEIDFPYFLIDISAKRTGRVGGMECTKYITCSEMVKTDDDSKKGRHFSIRKQRDPLGDYDYGDLDDISNLDRCRVEDNSTYKIVYGLEDIMKRLIQRAESRRRTSIESWELK